VLLSVSRRRWRYRRYFFHARVLLDTVKRRRQRRLPGSGGADSVTAVMVSFKVTVVKQFRLMQRVNVFFDALRASFRSMNDRERAEKNASGHLITRRFCWICRRRGLIPHPAMMQSKVLEAFYRFCK
jgi:hypothetical protein